MVVKILKELVSDYVKEYVPETEEPQRRELYRIAKENYDKAIYLLQKQIGIHMSKQMIEKLAENYVMERAYNYIDATIYNNVLALVPAI